MQTLFCWENAVDNAALSATSEGGNLAVYNLADPILKKLWRSLATTASFTVNFLTNDDGNYPAIGVLCLAGANLGANDSIRHRLYDASGIGILDATLSAGVAKGYGRHIYALASTLTAKTWQCDIVASSRSGAGTFDIGRAIAGPVWKPEIGISTGWQHGWKDDTPVNRGQYSGVVYTGTGAQYPVLDFTLDFMRSTDRDQALELQRMSGVRNQVLFVPDIDGDWKRQSVLGRFTTPALISEPRNVFPSAFSQHFRIEQDL